MKVGDILTYAFSYNARYPQFVVVTRATDKSVWYRPIEKRWAENDGYGQNGTVVPEPTHTPVGPESRSMIKRCGGLGEYCKIDGQYATVWNGVPEVEYTD